VSFEILSIYRQIQYRTDTVRYMERSSSAVKAGRPETPRFSTFSTARARGPSHDPEVTARPIYLDHHATTPVDPRVLEAMLPFFGERFGNAASRTHAYGSEARDAVEEARGRVAALVGARASEVVFTSGATEANNLAILGVARASTKKAPISTNALCFPSFSWSIFSLHPNATDIASMPDREQWEKAIE
jgi:selenocysteine lyase/cysteine desulfurase